MRGGGLRVAALACVLAGSASAWAAVESPLDACTPADGRWTYERLQCLYRTGRQHDRLDEARTRLRGIGAGRADQPWPTLVLGYATQQSDVTQAVALYELAADGFVRAKDAEGEVLARHNLRTLYARRGDADAASRQVARALAAADASKQPLTIARAAVLEASHLIETGGDLGRAYRTLLRVERFVFPSGPIGLRRAILFNLANASLYLGRLDDAIDALERHRLLRKEDGSSTDAAMVAFNLLNARLTKSEARPRPGARERLIAEGVDVLAETQRLNRPMEAAHVHRVLGDLLRATDPDAAADHLQRCIELEAELNQPALRAGCLWSLSLHDAARDPVSAERHSRQALAALAANPGGPLLAFAWRARLRLVWQTMSEEAAMPASLEALDAIERLRARQPDEGTRAALFSNWTSDYYWLTGRLLSSPRASADDRSSADGAADAAADGTSRRQENARDRAASRHARLARDQADTRDTRLARAFEVGERLRTRVLLERLARAGVSGVAAANSAPQPEYQRVERRIVETQRQLLSPALTEPGRRALLDQLQLLEIEEREVSAGVGGAASSAATPRAASQTASQTASPAASQARPHALSRTTSQVPSQELPDASSHASLQRVQEALGAREALLWFSIAPWTDVYREFGGGAWLASITRDAATLYRLPASLDLDSQVPALVGLLRERDMPVDRWDAPAARLGNALLGHTIAELPSTIERLVIVSDGALHRLPFEVLRPSAGAPRLGERFDVTIVPSATLWLHLRQRASAAPSSTRAAALVLADPELPAGSPTGDLRLDPLPWARREARAIGRTLQLDADAIREGRAATERSLKSTPLDRVAIVHLAAHARADDEFPDRSAVFLAPGDAAEDGWLQPREIAALDLRGRLVVLSACESADGYVLSGEGPLSLARAFFAGGASAVVATRWPLRDDDAAFVMEHFYRALGEGATIAAALRQARRDAIDNGRPAAAWAGLVLLGDGSSTPLPPSSRSSSASYESVAWSSWWMLPVGSVVLLGAAWLWIVRRR